MLSQTTPSQLTTSTKVSGVDIISTQTSILFEHKDLKQVAEQVALWTTTFSVSHVVNMQRGFVAMREGQTRSIRAERPETQPATS